MSLTSKAAVEFSLQTITDLINRAFSGYIGGDVQFAPYILANFLAQHDVNLGLSQIAVRDDEPVGLALVAQRGAESRVAMMGIADSAQGTGIGKWLMQKVINDAKGRGDSSLTLEVIEQNERAVRLYESVGFHSLRRLTGYQGVNLSGEAASLETVTLLEATQALTVWSKPDLPWPCSGQTLIKYAPPHMAYRMDNCYVLISDPQAERVVIRGLAVPVDRQRRGLATRFVSALLAEYPGKSWFVQAICPEEYGGIFVKNGFSLDRLSQFQMMLSW